MRELRVARAEDAKRPHLLAELLLHHCRHVDVGEHPKALVGERLGHSVDDDLEIRRERLAECVGTHRRNLKSVEAGFTGAC